MHGQQVTIAHAYRAIAVPIPRDAGWPCEFAIYQLDKVEVRDGAHRYAFQGVRQATYAEKFLFDGGRHLWSEL